MTADGFVGNVWLGLNKLDDYTAEYRWSDGSAGDYRSWQEGEPFEEAVRHCVYMDIKDSAGEYEIALAIWSPNLCKKNKNNFNLSIILLA